MPRDQQPVTTIPWNAVGPVEARPSLYVQSMAVDDLDRLLLASGLAEPQATGAGGAPAAISAGVVSRGASLG